LRRDARKHRAIAASLIETARVACSVLPDDQRDHTPSWHRDDIISVEPVRDDGPVRGARLTFRRVPGLTAEFLKHAYACARAQAAALGYDPTFLGYCPATVDGVRVEVDETPAGFVVTIIAERWDVAAVVYGRALDLKRVEQHSAID
jgi:hypothetical protein